MFGAFTNSKPEVMYPNIKQCWSRNYTNETICQISIAHWILVEVQKVGKSPNIVPRLTKEC